MQDYMPVQKLDIKHSLYSCLICGLSVFVVMSIYYVQCVYQILPPQPHVTMSSYSTLTNKCYIFIFTSKSNIVYPFNLP